MAKSAIKCKKCRYTLLEHPAGSLLLNAHSLPRTETKQNETCRSLVEETLFFLKEDSLPDWIKLSIGDVWTKGKINCKRCSARLGAYDFISGVKCNCGKFVLPAVHIIKSKVDI